jgi:hypothetical protein
MVIVSQKEHILHDNENNDPIMDLRITQAPSTAANSSNNSHSSRTSSKITHTK